MSTSLIAQDLRHFPPPDAAPPTSVARPRLIDRLRGGPRATNEPVVLLSAPAGAGKSIAVQQWLALDDREHLEPGLGPSPDDPVGLVRRLVEVLEQVGPPALDLRTLPTDAHGFSTVVLPALAGLVASRAADYVLVLDDVHLVREARCRDVLLTVCDAMPAGSQVVLLTRAEAPDWLARTRAAGRLTELSSGDLAFDHEEAKALFATSGVPGSLPDPADVLESTEGWAVALCLTVRSIQQHTGTGPDDGWTLDAQRYIADYVATEVLASLEPEFSSFLVMASVLDELTPELCDAVLERDDSAAVLACLRREVQLLVPVGTADDRLRLHRVLGPTLRSALARSTPSHAAVLHLRASRWYAERGDLDAAIRHAKAAKDGPEVGRLVWSGVATCLGRGDNDRLTSWLCDLSESQVDHDRWLTLSAAWLALQSGEMDRMLRLLLRAEGHAGTRWRERAAADEYAAALAVLVAAVGRGGIADLRFLCDAALEGLAPDSGLRATALYLQGVALALTREVEHARHSLADAERLARALRLPLTRVDVMSWQVVLALRAGDPRAARRLVHATPAVLHSCDLEPPATTALRLTAQSLVQAIEADPSAVTTLVTAREDTTVLDDVAPWFAVCSRLLQARAAVMLGERPLARRLITEATARMTRDLASSLARDLLDEAEAALGAATVHGVTLPALTAAELRVLRLLPSHLQLARIGDHLFLSRNTVKTHITAIYRKLGVASRDDAVAAARHLGLLEPPPGPAHR